MAGFWGFQTFQTQCMFVVQQKLSNGRMHLTRRFNGKGVLLLLAKNAKFDSAGSYRWSIQLSVWPSGFCRLLSLCLRRIGMAVKIQILSRCTLWKLGFTFTFLLLGELAFLQNTNKCCFLFGNRIESLHWNIFETTKKPSSFMVQFRLSTLTMI